MDITSSEAVPSGGLKSGPLRDPGIKAAPPNASSRQGSASFAWHLLTCCIASASVASTRTGASTTFSYIGTPSTGPSFRFALKTSSRTVSPKDGVGGTGQGTDR
jgi:hypothetical protein